MAARDLIIGGIHTVRSALALAPGDALELSIRIAPGPELEALAANARALGISVQTAAPATLDKLNGDPHHQGIVLRRRAPALRRLDDLLVDLGASVIPPLLLVLDTVQDPRNFGACLRVADAAGVGAVIYPRDKSAPLGSVVAKAASGAIDAVPLVAVANLASAMQALAKAGIWLTGATHDAEKSLYELDFTGPAAIVTGNEGHGLRRLTRDRCDVLAQIPMAGSVASLNVATATAVCLFEARRQRLAG